MAFTVLVLASLDLIFLLVAGVLSPSLNYLAMDKAGDQFDIIFTCSSFTSSLSPSTPVPVQGVTEQ